METSLQDVVKAAGSSVYLWSQSGASSRYHARLDDGTQIVIDKEHVSSGGNLNDVYSLALRRDGEDASTLFHEFYLFPDDLGRRIIVSRNMTYGPIAELYQTVATWFRQRHVSYHYDEDGEPQSDLDDDY